jgi:rhomboid family GlyGly-CTERM serine protease
MLITAMTATTSPSPSQPLGVIATPSRARHPILEAFSQKPELAGFALVMLVANLPVLWSSCWGGLIFQPGAVAAGEWWRVLTHPFVHVTWYHLLLDGAAFLLLYHSLLETSWLRRVGYVVAGAGGSLAAAWASGNVAYGLCGLSGVAHGLMAVSAVEMLCANRPRSAEWRVGLVTLAVVLGKAVYEALTGRMFFSFLDFGLLGSPVGVSHAGGIIGALVIFLSFRFDTSRSAVEPGV